MSANLPKTYYLFKAGRLTGPISHDRYDAMKLSGELLSFSWVIHEQDQKWTVIDPSPSENPFAASKKAIGERELSGAFLMGHEPIHGKVMGIHSYGIELKANDIDLRHLKMGVVKNIPLHLMDETHDQTLTTEVTFQGAEKMGDEVLIRFGWVSTPAQI
jgi:hypothetical protein